MVSQRSTLSSPRRAKRGGFALLLTITLLAFAVLLLVGLATYTRIETAIAGNMQRQTQARENALVALNVALGKLQESAGPDQRATATASGSANPYWTGAWITDPTNADYANPKWLVSGLESTTSPDPKATLDANSDANIRLVGPKTVSSTNEYVVVRKQNITTPGVPGQSGNATIGRYGWWVGDQGIKAPVALADPSAAVTFAPYDSADLQSRIRQQIALGPGAANASDGSPVFEPRDANNSTLLAGEKVTTPTQLAFLRNSSNTALGLSRVMQNFHAWSPNNFAVIANTKDGGLRQDLSLKPDLLGAPFVAWANYPAYMEKTSPDSTDTGAGTNAGSDTGSTTASAPTISPPYGTPPLRRRYSITPQIRGGGGSHQVGPILSYFELRFHVGTEGGSSSNNQPLELRAAWRISLWNPYTSALVPENLRIDVSGLPTNVEVWSEGDPQAADSVPVRAARFSLQSNSDPASLGSPLSISLPWNSTDMPSNASGEDRQSWLPGRVYTWRSIEDTTKGARPSDGYPSRFYTRSYVLDGAGNGETNQGVQRPITGNTVNGRDKYHLAVSGADPSLTVTLSVIRNGSPVRLATFTSPPFNDLFSTTPDEISAGNYQFGYVFRLKESLDTVDNPSAWLTSTIDFRRSRVPSEAFVVGAQGNSPEQYSKLLQSLEMSAPERLLDRGSVSYNEDVPLFELPRSPILSMGALQHFRIIGSRPFMIGNPWGAGVSLNGNPLGSLFDRFFFSGIVDGVTPATTSTGDLIMPNALLRPLRKSDGTKIKVDDVRNTATVPVVEPPTDTPPSDPATDTPEQPPTDTTVPAETDGRSSKYFLQAGAFNLNSTNAAAWAAVLRSVRFPSPQTFTYLDASTETGTAGDSATASTSSDDAQFFRFSQSAQETYKAEEGQSAPGDSTTPPNTHLFRKGMRTLTGAQVAALAGKIVELMAVKHTAADAAGGPFRSLEEFLAPNALFAGVDSEGNAGASRSLLEAAIADAGINASIAEFSSQWLTQADIMTALAPVLYARSDTFLIRTYGEAVNPVTNAIEGRAWCEAIVQRVPDYMDPSDPPETLPSAFDAPSNADDPTSTPTTAHQLNKQLGRRFKVVSFRWLTRSDI